MQDRIEQVMTPQAVPPTPGVNAPVAKPAPAKNDATPAGHWLDNAIAGRGDMMTSLFEPEVIKDRMRAEKELAGRFDIVDSNHKGPKLPNQVTRAEYQKLVNTYSDIRMGRGDLTIDASKAKDPDQYRADMMDDIADILQTKSGRELIGGLSNSTNIDEDGNTVHRHTTIAPALDEKGNPDTDLTAERAVGGSAFGKNIHNDDGTPGVGTDTLINFNPNMDVTENNEQGDVVGRTRSDVALYHELVHSYTDTRGHTKWGNITEDESFVSAVPGARLKDPDVVADANSKSPVSRAEYQAAGLGLHRYDRLTENAYRKERTQVAKSGKGIAGDMLMPQRTRYAESNNDYKTIGGK